METTQQPSSAGYLPDDLLKAIPALTILEHLRTGVSSFSIMLMTPEAQVIYANNIAANGFEGHTVDSIKGVFLADIVPDVWMKQRLQLMERTVTTDRAQILIEIIEGMRLCSRIQSVHAKIDSGSIPLVLYTLEPIKRSDLSWLRPDRA